MVINVIIEWNQFVFLGFLGNSNFRLIFCIMFGKFFRIFIWLDCRPSAELHGMARGLAIKGGLVVVVLPDPDGARRSNSLATPQGLVQRSQMEKVVSKTVRRRRSDAKQSRRWVIDPAGAAWRILPFYPV